MGISSVLSYSLQAMEGKNSPKIDNNNDGVLQHTT